MPIIKFQKFEEQLGLETAIEFFDRLAEAIKNIIEEKQFFLKGNVPQITPATAKEMKAGFTANYPGSAVRSLVHIRSLNVLAVATKNCLHFLRKKAAAKAAKETRRNTAISAETVKLLSHLQESAQKNSEVELLEVQPDLLNGITIENENSPKFIPIPFANFSQAKEAVAQGSPMIPFLDGVIAASAENTAFYISKKLYQKAHRCLKS